MSRATSTNNFFNQKAMFTSMKPCAYLLISNYVWQRNLSGHKSMIITFLFQITARSEVSKKEQRKQMVNKNWTWQHLLLLFLSCCFPPGQVGCGPLSHEIISILHVFVHSALFQFLGDPAATLRICTESRLHIIKSHQVLQTLEMWISVGNEVITTAHLVAVLNFLANHSSL